MKQITSLKLIAICMIILAIMSACGTVDATNDSPRVTDTASKIADFELPADYIPQFSAAMSGYTLVAYQGPSDPSHLFIVQSDKEADGSELEKALKELAPGSSDPNTRMTVIENRMATIRGQEVNVVISEGVNSENVAYRQITVGFQGKGGPALLMFSDSVERWNQETVDAFLESIH